MLSAAAVWPKRQAAVDWLHISDSMDSIKNK